jgi:hypothetical protein
MDEEEWLAATDPMLMLDSIPHPASERKAVLFAVACCRAILTDHREWREHIILAVEKYVDGLATAAEVIDASRNYNANSDASPVVRLAMMFELPQGSRVGALAACVGSVAHVASFSASDSDWLPQSERDTEVPRRKQHQATLLRDIFGNPFRSVALDPEWRTSTATALARGMYESRDFGAMPILADALQDAGCDSDDILNHCRGDGPHVRGCWVVDLVLGKE